MLFNYELQNSKQMAVFFPLTQLLKSQQDHSLTNFLAGSIGRINNKGPATSLWVEWRAKADVVFGGGADEG